MCGDYIPSGPALDAILIAVRPVDSAELVVVGAGSSGAVIASRVSERSDREVLLLEAGPDYPPDVPLPRDLADGTRNSWRRHDWRYSHSPTPGQIAFVYPRGKVVGGSSAVNTCIALRAQPHDLDEWDLPVWRWERCLPYFRRLERDLDFDGPIHGRDGPIPIRRHTVGELAPWQSAFVEACRGLGFRDCLDMNDPVAEPGVAAHPMNKIDGIRMSAARAYLDATVRARPQLRIRADTHVRRVLVRNRRVYGVEVQSLDGDVQWIAARKVVLAGGAIGTPLILFRSGIGPDEQLCRIGVEPICVLPGVGRRLLDHPGAAIFLLPRGGASSFRHPLIQTVLRFDSNGSDTRNDMMLQPGSFVPIHPLLTLPAVSLMCAVGKPKGHGTLVVESADVRAKPRIDSQFLRNPDDHARAVDAIELAYRCASTPVMRAIARFIWPREATLRDRDALGRWIFRSCGSGYHPCGTVPMGHTADPNAATDDHGRVRGIDGLVVADASLMPTIPSANTNLTVLMMGERFGEWLRDGSDL
ncbi:MAG: GMC family oxidoreductase N-terminal domain-containing protein [Deltaproteobacteria bacterium]|nr:GMC family oxidoreductase N-terminal domain-containing protein [Deltaproteobacteria bacterium]